VSIHPNMILYFRKQPPVLFSQLMDHEPRLPQLPF
jgi:hypothetical protein